MSVRRREMVTIAVLMAAAYAGALGYLSYFDLKPGPLQGFGDPYAAIGVATGHGYAVPSEHAPGVREFLSGESETLDVEALQSSHWFRPATGKFDLDRIYLLYTVGWLWRIMGISWDALNLLTAVFFAVMAGAVYGIFRVACRGPIALAGAVFVVSSPLTLVMLPRIRDFSKAPFVLVPLLCCAVLLSGRLGRRDYLLLSAGTGLATGVGIGFRQDAIISLPVALLCMALFCGAHIPWRVRAMGMALCMAAFLPPALPILRMNVQTGGNNSFYLSQGFSEPSLRELQLDGASYTPLYTNSDYIVHGHIARYREHAGLDYLEHARRYQLAAQVQGAAQALINPLNAGLVMAATQPVDAFGIWSYPAEQTARHMLRHLFMTFPADVLTRAYGSVLRILRGIDSPMPPGNQRFLESWTAWRLPVYEALHRLALPMALLAMAVLGAHRPWVGLGACGVLLYYLGYPSLQFELRHAFHLQFATLLFPLFLLDRLLRWKHMKRPPLRVIVQGMALVLGLAVAMALPLYAARLWQGANTEKLVAQYEGAELSPVSTEAEAGEWGTLHKVGALPRFDAVRNPPLLASLTGDMPDVEVEYLAADIEFTAPGAHCAIRYQDRAAFFDGFPTMPYSDATYPLRVRFFFPVFEFTSRFAGLPTATTSTFGGLELGEGATLLGMHRVEDPTQFPLLMAMWLPEDRELLQMEMKLRLTAP